MAVVAAAVVLASVPPRLDAALPGVTVTSVGGQPVTAGVVSSPLEGTVEVTGTASLAGSGTVAPPPLVADAGDSPFVAAGEPATLLGSVGGGTAPYTYAWTADAGTIAEGADGPAAVLDTTDVPPGRHLVHLTVVDGAGMSSTDDVVAVVFEPASTVLVDRSVDDPTPGVLGAGVPGTLEIPFDVPPDAGRLDVTVSWRSPLNDYDVRVLDPAGEQQASAATGLPNTSEVAAVEEPEPGPWTVAADKFLALSDHVRTLVTAEVAPPDPRPLVAAGGPYRFAVGEPVQLDATVSGGTAPVAVAWDLDGDGVFERAGPDVQPALAPGRHLVTVKATGADGLERRQTTSVLVADAARLAADTTPLTVIGISDTGVNPYHLEFSATTYPDPDVLALTRGFTAHPSTYLPGYPADAPALGLTLGEGWYPPADVPTWAAVEPGKLYWIPGTKIIGAFDADASTGVQSPQDPNRILDDNGHGSGSASVAAGNRYGYCPTCLLVVVEGLDASLVNSLPWVDISSNSFGTVGGVPLGVLGGDQPSKDAVERGQTVLYAAGNGVGNAYDVPQITYGSSTNGPDWNITVGAVRRDNQRAIVGDAVPVHLSSWGDGNLPSVCRSGTVGQCAFGGTSAATPYTAGLFGTVLTRVRDALGDAGVGQRQVGEQRQVIAEGVPGTGAYVGDGLLTRAELREAMLEAAQPLPGEPSPFPYPLTSPNVSATNVLFEGYGAATPLAADRATAVLLGRAPRLAPPEEAFFALDRRVRDTLYGGYDRDGDGAPDSEGFPLGPGALGLAGGVSPAGLDLGTALAALGRAASADTPPTAPSGGSTLAAAQAGSTPGDVLTYHLHRRLSADPGSEVSCADTHNEQYMDRDDTPGDLEPCFESRVTSVLAAYRPLGIWASGDVLDRPLPAGSEVAVDLYLTTEAPSLVRPTGVLMATDRELGAAEGPFQVVGGGGPGGALCPSSGETCWTHYRFGVVTARPAFAGEQLTFQVQLLGTRSWAFGYEGLHASRLEVRPAPAVPGGSELAVSIETPVAGDGFDEGATVAVGGAVRFPDLGPDPAGAGDHPVARRVEVSVDDPTFSSPIEATLDRASRSWVAPARALGAGAHTIYARARVDHTVSPPDSVTVTMRPGARVEWQVVPADGEAEPAGWRTAAGFEAWSFAFDTSTYGSGPKRILVRSVAAGAVVADAAVAASFR